MDEGGSAPKCECRPADFSSFSSERLIEILGDFRVLSSSIRRYGADDDTAP